MILINCNPGIQIIPGTAPSASFKFELYGVICVYRFVEVSIYFHFVTVNPGNGDEVQIETFLVIFIFINLFVGLISC